MSLARRHRETVLAARAAEQAAANDGQRTGAAASEYELMRARLGVDLRRLSEIQSIERKIDLKRELLPEYDAWVSGVLAADAGVADDVLTHVMIWRIDTGDFAGALPLASYVIRHDLPLPDRFDRTAATLVAEEIAEAAIKALAGGTFPLEILLAVDALVDGADIFDQVRAKLEKAIGLALAATAEATDATADGPAGARAAGLTQARAHLARALSLDGNVGVKKRIEKIDAELKKLAQPQGAA